MVRVVFHIDEMAKWPLLIKNVHNLVEALPTESQIKILANAEAVGAYVKTAAADEILKINDLNEKGAQFVACNNALKSMGIQKEQLAEFVKIVPVGVLELIERQAEGYAYIKP